MNQHPKHSLFCSFILIILVNGFFHSCKRVDVNQRYNKTLHLEITQDIRTLDPAISYDTVSAGIIYQMYETLYEYHYLKRPYTLKPLLAEGMPTISDLGRKYTIKIKKGIYYQYDPCFKNAPREVKAQDFVDQIKRVAFTPLNSSGFWIFDNKVKGINKFRQEVGDSFEKFKKHHIAGLYAENDHTLIIELNNPYPPLINYLAMAFTVPIPMECLEYYKNDLSKNVIATGPYNLHKYVPNEMYHLKKNPDYHKEIYPGEGDRLANEWGLLEDAGKKIPFINEVKIHVIQDLDKKWYLFRNKNLHALSIPRDFHKFAITPFGKLRPELKKENIRLMVAPTLTYWWLAFNMEDPFIGKNKYLRKAMAHAIDVDAFISHFTSSLGQKANSIFPPGVPGYDPSTELSFTYDLKKAKDFLVKAGHPGGQGLPELTYSLRGNDRLVKEQAEFIKESLEKIGIKIKLDFNDFNEFLSKKTKGTMQMWYGGWAMDYPDAENILQLLYGPNKPPGPNAAFFQNAQADRLIELISQLPNGRKKTKLMAEFESIVQEELPWVLLFYARSYIVYHDQLKNFRPSDVIYNYVKYLKLH